MYLERSKWWGSARSRAISNLIVALVLAMVALYVVHQYLIGVPELPPMFAPYPPVVV